MLSTFLASFRGADGRSLARALAVLLVISGCLSAIHSGRMAEVSVGGTVVCGVNGAYIPVSGDSTPLFDQHHCICCTFGCGNAANCALPGAIARIAATTLAADAASLVHTAFLPAAKNVLAAGPRGPPVLI